MSPTVVVVEDEPKIRELLRSYLEREQLTVLTTGSGAEGIELVRATTPDLLVLDLRLPDVPGEEVAREVRASTAVPILMLTAKSSTGDRIHGLELGADDYITKPFSPRELMLRVRVILRRGCGGTPAEEVESFGGGRLVLDHARRLVTVQSRPVELTTTEWRLLATLAGTPGRVFSRYELVNRIRGYDFTGYERTVDSHVRNLRRKVESGPGGPALIATVIGAGYRFVLERDRSAPHTPREG